MTYYTAHNTRNIDSEPLTYGGSVMYVERGPVAGRGGVAGGGGDAGPGRASSPGPRYWRGGRLLLLIYNTKGSVYTERLRFQCLKPVMGSINLSCTFCNVRPKSRCFVRHTTHNMKAASLSDEF